MDSRYVNTERFHQIVSQNAGNPEFQDLMRDYAQVQYVYAAAIREITSRLEALDSEFQYRHKHNPIHHIQSRVKTLQSIASKLTAMQLPVNITNAKKNLHDIAGVRVVCCYVDDIYRIANLLLEQDDISLIEEKDYIKKPKENGYRSLHMVVDVSVYLSQGKIFIPVEIQIRTVAMDFWATLEHGIRYKSFEEVPTFINDELRACADIIAKTDDKMEEIFKAIQLLSDAEENRPLNFGRNGE